MDLRIEPTKNADAIARLNHTIQEHHRLMYPLVFKPHSLEEVRSFLAKQLEDPTWHCRVACLDGREAGYVLFYVRDYPENPFRRAYKGVHIDQISVLPEAKRNGVGRALMAEVETFARKENASQLELTFWDRNEEAKTFYKQLGFSTCIRFEVKPLA